MRFAWSARGRSGQCGSGGRSGARWGWTPCARSCCPRGARQCPGPRWPRSWSSPACVSRRASCISPRTGIVAPRWRTCSRSRARRSTTLYRALDRLLPHKPAIETHLKERLGELFALDYDLLLYDVTSTYFEGLAAGNPLAQRGYSRDHRPDCKQVNIALVVTRGGVPLGYEVFAGNRTDVTTVQEIVETMEERYGTAERIWVMDRGMASRKTIGWLQATGRQYLIGTPRAELTKWSTAIAATQIGRAHV